LRYGQSPIAELRCRVKNRRLTTDTGRVEGGASIDIRAAI
jgi:hypothetical protein